MSGHGHGVLTVGVHLFDELLQDLLVEGLTHEPEDVGDHVAGDGAGVFPVEGIESLAEDCNMRTARSGPVAPWWRRVGVGVPLGRNPSWVTPAEQRQAFRETRMCQDQVGPGWWAHWLPLALGMRTRAERAARHSRRVGR